MKFISSVVNFILKLIQIVPLLFVPPLVIYFLLLQMDLQALYGIKALLGSFFDSFISMIGKPEQFSFQHQKAIIDYRPIILVFILIGITLVFSLTEQILNFLSEKIKIAKEINQRKINEQIELQNEKDFATELEKHKTIYLTLKFVKSESSLSYLITESEGENVKSEADKIIEELINYSESYNCQIMEQSEVEVNTYNFVFNDVKKAVNYTLHIYETIKKIAPELINIGVKISFSAALHCALNKVCKDTDLEINKQLLYLAGENEIYTTGLFKNRYEILNENTPFKFHSKGFYTIFENKSEIFQFRKNL